MIIPRPEDIIKIKCTDLKMYMYVSKNLIMRIILEWEKIRPQEERHATRMDT